MCFDAAGSPMRKDNDDFSDALFTSLSDGGTGITLACETPPPVWLQLNMSQTTILYANQPCNAASGWLNF